MITLTDEQRDVLTATDLTVAAGCELLDLALTVVDDISDDLLDGQIEWGLHDNIHRKCDLLLSRALVWGVDLVRPYMLLNGVRFDLGVFCLTTPDRQVAEDLETYSVQGFDRVMLLLRQVGADYTVTAGTTYRAALLAVFTAAGLSGVLIEGAAADDVLPADRDWPLVARTTDPDQTDTPVTWLRIVNDLLRAINFRAVWCDEQGLFRCGAYRAPATRAAEWTFDADELLTLVGEQRTVAEDVWATPNRWVFRQTNRPAGAPVATEGDGIYTVDNLTDGPTSQSARGLIWPSVIDYEAATHAKLVELGDRRIALDRRVERRLTYPTAPFPAAGHGDVFSVVDAAAGVSAKVQATSWRYGLTGSDVEWEWEVIG